MLHVLRSSQKTYERKVLELAPIAFFPLTDTSGAVATDISGNARHGSYVGGTLASGVIRHKPVFTVNGIDAAHANVYSAALNTAFGRAAGSIIIWGSYTGNWLDAVDRSLFRIYTDGSNKMRVLRPANSQTLSWEIAIGGNVNTIGARMQYYGTTPFCTGWSWHGATGLVRVYLDGAKLITISGYSNYVGNISSSYLLAARAGTADSSYWQGPVGYLALFDKVLTDAQFAALAVTPLEAPVVYPDGFTIVHCADSFQTSTNWPSGRYEIITATQWVIDNAAKYNIQGYFYSGDIVETVGDATQWAGSKAGFDLLGATEIPYHVTTGNHDYTDLASRTKASFDTDYPQSRYNTHGWYNGAFYEANKSENSYITFTVGSKVYLIMSLEHQPRAAVKTWANGILTANPNANVILFTHDYMDGLGALSVTGQSLWDDVIKIHDNVILVCCGHYINGRTAHRTDLSNGGRAVHQMHYDGHDYRHYIRLITIRPAVNKIMVQTYEPVRQRLWNDTGMQFELTLP
jgi:hypothetical protein